MIKIDMLKDLLNLEERDLKRLEDEQLKTLLGVLHYGARQVERELNKRDEFVNK